MCLFYFPPCLYNVGWGRGTRSCLCWTTTSTCTRGPVFISFGSLVGFKTIACDIPFSLFTLLMEKTLKQNKYFLLLSNKRLKSGRGKLVKSFRNGSRLCSRMSGRWELSTSASGSHFLPYPRDRAGEPEKCPQNCTFKSRKKEQLTEIYSWSMLSRIWHRLSVFGS